MTTPQSSTPSAVCAFCDKQGLPILPVRYAIARADMGHAPVLPATFKADVAAIDLPADTARYTLRLLRPGFLYVFDEQRNEWSGYVVNEQSYLYAFDVHAKSPPQVGNKTFNDACKAKSDPYKARCITVKDAAHATRVWLGFSDTPWTSAVLSKHSTSAYRTAHMQCIDVASWRGGGTPAHMAAFDSLNQVAEFAADGAALQKETRTHVQRFLPAPYRQPEDLIRTDAASQQALGMLPPKVQQWVASSIGKPAMSGPVKTAAWAFSPHEFFLTREETAALAAWGATAGKPWRPALVGLLDPVGIAMELNGLAIQRCVEFAEQADRKWQMETAGAIEAIHKAVLNGAMEGQSQKQQAAAAIALPFVPTQLIRDSGNLTDMSRNLEQAGQVSPADKVRLDADVWPRYAGMLDPQSLSTAKKQYRDELGKLDREVVAPIDQAYLAWLKSKAFTNCFSHNFDPDDANNGVIYQQVVHGCIAHASGRIGSSSYFAECLGQDPAQSTSVVLRALIFNQQQLAVKWTDAAVEKAGSHVEWWEVGGKFYEAVKDTFAASSLGRDIEGPLRNISKCLYQLAGPITQLLGEAVNQVADIGLARLPERRLMTLMMAVLHAEHPNLELVDLRGMQTPRQGAKALARAIAAMSGGGAQNLYKSAETLLREPEGASGVAFRGLFLIDRDKLKAMKGANNAARLMTVKPETFEALLEDSTRALVNPEVKAGIVSAILNAVSVGASYKELIKADDKGVKSMNFVAGVTSLVGGSVETAGHAIEKMPWVESAVSLALRKIGVAQEFSAKWLIGTGRWLGVAGGVLAGLLQMWDGRDEYEYNPTLGVTMIVLGFLEGTAAILVITPWTGVGLVIGLLIVAAVWVVGHFKTDDIQKWLAKSKFGFLEDKREQFQSLLEQQSALSKLAKG
ncbi:T6SS effector BTH_I2691 family protein [Paraburkholderia solisilvae]|uniref:Toxin VasX N-terminal region domain-containing protein n=1 Tax=Paraburkholderia solisilvae TaxID=624376 RepID=A0A6J5DB49_9BURK|nr:T6SS effector BTH_I2691 family protein [Paraburkholderia solisilvae]CAB3751499.1 hypothetical protein LMG29739_01299 [Paraburkholderia solisilvae]